MDKAFIEQLIRHGSELRTNNGLTKEKWNAISTSISTELGFQLDVKHLKNHFKIWKSNYVQVRELRGLSGFEWDNKRKLVDAVESVWVDLIKAHPAMARWRYRSFPLYDDLAIVMGDAHATGDMLFTWNELGFIDVGEGEDIPGSYNNQPPVVDVDGNNFTQADPNLPSSSYDDPSPTSLQPLTKERRKKEREREIIFPRHLALWCTVFLVWRRTMPKSWSISQRRILR